MNKTPALWKLRISRQAFKLRGSNDLRSSLTSGEQHIINIIVILGVVVVVVAIAIIVDITVIMTSTILLTILVILSLLLLPLLLLSLVLLSVYMGVSENRGS